MAQQKVFVYTIPTKKRTSIGTSPLSKPKNKHKRRSFKRYRGKEGKSFVRHFKPHTEVSASPSRVGSRDSRDGSSVRLSSSKFSSSSS